MKLLPSSLITCELKEDKGRVRDGHRDSKERDSCNEGKIRDQAKRQWDIRGISTQLPKERTPPSSIQLCIHGIGTSRAHSVRRDVWQTKYDKLSCRKPLPVRSLAM